MTDERKPREWTVEEIWNRVDSFNTGDLPDVLIDKSAYDDLERRIGTLNAELTSFVYERNELERQLAEFKGLHDTYIQTRVELREARAEIERLNGYSKDHEDDWKRIQDAERALERYRNMCERLAESILRADIECRPYSQDEFLAAYHALKEKK